MQPPRVLIFGASSAIAERTARLFAAEHARFYLVGRDADKLEAVRDDLLTRGAAAVATDVCDGLDFDAHPHLVERSWQAYGGFDCALIAHGSLPDQEACERSFDVARRELESNFLSQVSLLLGLANRFEAQGSGSIAVISSVSGDRGRRSNYVYGAAKAGLTVFLQGLRIRLAGSKVNVVIVKPGFVDTPMTQHMRKGFLWAQPETVAKDIHRAIRKGKGTVYTPAFWRFVMLGIRSAPDRLLAALKL